MANEIRATMPGSIFKICLKPGDSFEVGDAVAILESMKMEIPIEAEVSGIVDVILVQEGDSVEEDGAILTYK